MPKSLRDQLNDAKTIEEIVLAKPYTPEERNNEINEKFRFLLRSKETAKDVVDLEYEILKVAVDLVGKPEFLTADAIISELHKLFLRMEQFA